MRKGFIFPVILILIFCGGLHSQTEYYTATGKDSITYLSSNKGLVTLKRDSTEHLYSVAVQDDGNKVYTISMDTDNYLALATDSHIDIYSLSDKYHPSLIGGIDINSICAIRRFGDHFAVIRTGNTYHYIIGVVNDSVKFLDSVYAPQYSYFRTPWYPEVVYPYFFSTASNLIMYKFIEDADSFQVIDTFAVVNPGYTFVQMYGGDHYLFTRVKKSSGDRYELGTAKWNIMNDNLLFTSSITESDFIPFTDEIECTDKLVRLNGRYRDLNFTPLSSSSLLNSYANLSGDKVYNTRDYPNPTYAHMYYSTTITGRTIDAAEYVYTAPAGIETNNVPLNFNLESNHPNPFNSSTVIKYSLPAAAEVKMEVFNITGERIAVLKNEIQQAGRYELTWDAAKNASGIYFCLLSAYTNEGGNYRSVLKMVYLR